MNLYIQFLYKISCPKIIKQYCNIVSNNYRGINVSWKRYLTNAIFWSAVKRCCQETGVFEIRPAWRRKVMYEFAGLTLRVWGYNRLGTGIDSYHVPESSTGKSLFSTDMTLSRLRVKRTTRARFPIFPSLFPSLSRHSFSQSMELQTHA